MFNVPVAGSRSLFPFQLVPVSLFPFAVSTGMQTFEPEPIGNRTCEPEPATGTANNSNRNCSYLKLSMISSSAALPGRVLDSGSVASGSSTTPSNSTKSCLSGST